MNEKDFSQKLTRYLDSGLSQIADRNLVKLHAARSKALALHREPVRILGLVTVSGRVFEPAYFIRKPLFWLPILAVAIAATVLFQTNAQDDLYDASGAIDAKLLTGELPIDAFLDKDFATWVKEKEATPQP